MARKRTPVRTGPGAGARAPAGARTKPAATRPTRATPAAALQETQRQSFGHLLFTCARMLDEIAQAQVNREAGERIARPALMRLLPFLDFEGVRPTDLARRVDVSKQAVGQSLAALEDKGLVEFVADPEDRRALRVRLTARGAAAFQHGLDVLAFFERELGARVGAARVGAATEALQAIAEVLAAWQAGGAPAR